MSEYPRCPAPFQSPGVPPKEPPQAPFVRGPSHCGPGHYQPPCPPRLAGQRFPSPQVLALSPWALGQSLPTSAVPLLEAARGRPRPGPAARSSGEGGWAGGRPAGGGARRAEQLPAAPAGNQTPPRPAALHALASCPTDLGLPGSTPPLRHKTGCFPSDHCPPSPNGVTAARVTPSPSARTGTCARKRPAGALCALFLQGPGGPREREAAASAFCASSLPSSLWTTAPPATARALATS